MAGPSQETVTRKDVHTDRPLDGVDARCRNSAGVKIEYFVRILEHVRYIYPKNVSEFKDKIIRYTSPRQELAGVYVYWFSSTSSGR